MRSTLRQPRTGLFQISLVKALGVKATRDLRLTKYGIELVKDSDVLELFHSYIFISCTSVPDAANCKVKIQFTDNSSMMFICANYKELILNLNEMVYYHRTLNTIHNITAPYPEGKPAKQNQIPYSMETLLNEVSETGGDSLQQFLKEKQRTSGLDLINKVHHSQLTQDTYLSTISNKTTQDIYHEFYELLLFSPLNKYIKSFIAKMRTTVFARMHGCSRDVATQVFCDFVEQMTNFRNSLRIKLVNNYKDAVVKIYLPPEVRFSVNANTLVSTVKVMANVKAGGAAPINNDKDLLFIIGECINCLVLEELGPSLCLVFNVLTHENRKLLKAQFDRITERLVSVNEGSPVGDAESIMKSQKLNGYLFELFGVNEKLQKCYFRSVIALKLLCSKPVYLSLEHVISEFIQVISCIYEESKAGGSEGICGADDLISVLSYCMYLAGSVEVFNILMLIGTTKLPGGGKEETDTKALSLKDFLTRNDEGSYYAIVLETCLNSFLTLSVK